jgi:hypothetical protein
MTLKKIAKIGSWEFDIVNKKMLWSAELYSIYEVKRILMRSYFSPI